MSDDICFLCREKCSDRICYTCNIKSHQKCLKSYKRGYQRLKYDIDLLNESRRSARCPQCNEIIMMNKPCTRNYTKNSKNIIIYDIRNYIISIENAHSGQNKKQISSELFDYISNNIIIIKRHKKLYNTILLKINQLKNQGWKEADIYYYRIFTEI